MEPVPGGGGAGGGGEEPGLQYLLQSSSVHGWTRSDGALDKLQNLPALIIWQGCWLFEGEVGAPLHPRVLSPSTCTLCI